MCSKMKTTSYTKDYWDNIGKIKSLIDKADAVVIGAGAGLSASAGLHYSGERFQRLFADFIEEYGLRDMYSSAFYNFKTREEYWAYFSRHIHCNRYDNDTNDSYKNLLNLVENKNYFVITTNVDHLFIKSGFSKDRLFYTQGDYGLFQCSKPCHKKTYDNKDIVEQMVKLQKDCKIPTELIPKCPLCGKDMEPNLRKDSAFVEDEGWHKAMNSYDVFLKKNLGGNILFFELGIGYNTPSIIKYPFWQMTYQNSKASYISINLSKDNCPKEIIDKSLCITGDIAEVLSHCVKEDR